MSAGQRPRHAQVLDALRQAGAPLGVADVASRLGIHANTARFHLDALVASDAAIRTLEPPSGPGRPRAVYSPRPGMDRGGIRSYRLLAQILLSHLSSAGPGAAENATQAGRAWGGFLIGRPPPFEHLTDEAAVTRLTGLLAELGFGPEPGVPEPGVPEPRGPGPRGPGPRGPGPRGPGPWMPDPGVPEPDGAVPAVIRLRHCPFLELAEEYDQLVCRIHLGLMQGALAELRTPVIAARLEPFAEPGACLAHLEHASAA